LHSNTSEKHQIVSKNKVNRDKITKHQHSENEGGENARQDLFEAEPEKFGQESFERIQWPKIKRQGIGRRRIVLKNHNWGLSRKYKSV
jgi:hypothetical protein